MQARISTPATHFLTFGSNQRSNIASEPTKPPSMQMGVAHLGIDLNSAGFLLGSAMGKRKGGPYLALRWAWTMVHQK